MTTYLHCVVYTDNDILHAHYYVTPACKGARRDGLQIEPDTEDELSEYILYDSTGLEYEHDKNSDIEDQIWDNYTRQKRDWLDAQL